MRPAIFSYKNLELFYLPSDTYTIEELPKKSIAIDGIVEGSNIDAYNYRFSFDHHYKNIPRHSQASSVKQILDALMVGWKPPTRDGKIWVFFSDVDLDCISAIFLLILGQEKINRRVVEWIDVVNAVDIFGPAYKFYDEKYERIKDFLYYKILRKHKGKTSIEMITSILDKFQYYYDKEHIYYNSYTKKYKNLVVLEKSNFINPDFPEHDLNLLMIISDDQVFEYAYRQGADVVIAIRRKPSGRYKYSIAKRDDFVPYNINLLLKKISERESGWGGASTIIGSPEEGSEFSPYDLAYLLKRGTWNVKKQE